jgi:integrase
MTMEAGREGSKSGRTTFAKCAARYLKGRESVVARPAMRNWRASLDRYALPTLGDVPIRTVTPEQVCNVLEPIWITKPETARRLRARLEVVFEFAIAAGHLKGPNPAAWSESLKQRLPDQPARERVRAPSLPAADVAAFVSALHQVDSVAARALEFGILTLVRQSELIGARWADIHDMRTWRIPGQLRMNNQSRILPLSSYAVEVLQRIPDRGELIFRRATGLPVSTTLVAQALRRVRNADGSGWFDRFGRPITFAGFRDTFREWASEIAGFGPEQAEIALGGRDTQSLTRDGTLRVQRKMLDGWAEFCATGTPQIA